MCVGQKTTLFNPFFSVFFLLIIPRFDSNKASQINFYLDFSGRVESIRSSVL